MSIRFHRCGENTSDVEIDLDKQVHFYQVTLLDGTDDATIEVYPHKQADDENASIDIDPGWTPIEDGTVTFTGGKAPSVKFSGFFDKVKMSSPSTFGYIVTGGD